MANLVKKGKKFRVLASNSNSHNYAAGRVYEAIYDDKGSGVMGRDPDSNWQGNTITFRDYAIVELTREEISTQLDELKKKYEKDLARLQSMLDFLEKTGQTVYDEMKHRCYVAITSLNSDATDMEKAEVIARLVNGEF